MDMKALSEAAHYPMFFFQKRKENSLDKDWYYSVYKLPGWYFVDETGDLMGPYQTFSDLTLGLERYVDDFLIGDHLFPCKLKD